MMNRSPLGGGSAARDGTEGGTDGRNARETKDARAKEGKTGGRNTAKGRGREFLWNWGRKEHRLYQNKRRLSHLANANFLSNGVAHC
eukprot:11294784-Karenia_brevis.AAC.1